MELSVVTTENEEGSVDVVRRQRFNAAEIGSSARRASAPAQALKHEVAMRRALERAGSPASFARSAAFARAAMVYAVKNGLLFLCVDRRFAGWS